VSRSYNPEVYLRVSVDGTENVWRIDLRNEGVGRMLTKDDREGHLDTCEDFLNVYRTRVVGISLLL